VDKVVGMEYKHFKSLRLMRSEPGLQKMLGTREKFQQLSGSGKRDGERERGKMSNCYSNSSSSSKCNCNRRPHALRTNEKGEMEAKRWLPCTSGTGTKWSRRNTSPCVRSRARKWESWDSPVPLSIPLDTGFVIADSCGQPW